MTVTLTSFSVDMSSRKALLEKAKELLATLGFLLVFIGVLIVVGYIISVLVDTTSTHATEIKTEKECKEKGHAWHAVQGCMTHEVFTERYIDR